MARAQGISYQDLRQLVHNLGSRIGPVSGEEGRKDRAPYRDKRKEREDGPLKSQRLLLTWLIENPKLFDKIEGIITPDDFREELYHKVAVEVFEGHQKGDVNPAGILNHFIDDEEQYKTVASLFHASLKESLTNEEQKKAFSETVLKVKKNSLDEASRRATDIRELQEIIRAQSALKTLNISID